MKKNKKNKYIPPTRSLPFSLLSHSLLFILYEFRSIFFFSGAKEEKKEEGEEEAEKPKKEKAKKRKKKERCGSRTTCWASHLGENLDKVCTSALRF